MRARIKRKTLSLLLAVVALTAFWMLNIGIQLKISYADDTGKVTGMPAITLGTESANPTVVTFGGKKWVVIGYNGNGVASKSGTMTLFLASGNGYTNSPYFNPGYTGYTNAYSGSNLQTQINDRVYNSLTDREKALISPRDLIGGSANQNEEGFDPDKIKGDTVFGAAIWPLSIAEAQSLNIDVLKYSYLNTDGDWWLRSPGFSDSQAMYVNKSGLFCWDSKLYTHLMRPAFLLDLSKVFFASTSNGEVRLTGLDSSLSLSSTDTATRLVRSGDTVNIAFSGASYGSNRYITCVIGNSNGEMVYNNRLFNCGSESFESGTASFMVPSLADGNYTINLYCEEPSSDIDFCSRPIEIPMEVDNTAPVLTDGSINRTSDTEATISFTVDTECEVFYKVVDSGVNLSDKSDVISSGNSLGMVNGTVMDKAIILTAGDKDIYIVAVDAMDNICEPMKLIAYGDYTAPVLSGGSISRTSDTNGTIGFTTNEEGEAFYIVVDKNAQVPSKNTVAAGISLGPVNGTVIDKAITLTAGDKYVYVVVRDVANNISEPLRLITYGDRIAPVLSSGSINRTSDTEATIGFITDKEGEAFYKVVDSGVTLSGKSDVINSGTSLGPVNGTVTDKAVTLTAGDKDIYMVVRDYVGNISEPLKMIAYGDYTAPTLSGGSINRTGHTEARIGFTTDEAGEAFYTLVDNGAGVPSKETVTAGTSLGQVVSTVTDKVIPLTAGAKDIYIVVRDAVGNISTPLKIEAAVYLSPEKNITGVTSPGDVTIGGTVITVSVARSVTSQTVSLSVSENASWKLYSDASCQNEITDRTMMLSPGANTAYVQVTAENGSTKVYTLTVYRQITELPVAAPASIYFGGIHWDVIGYNGSGIASTSGTMTLLRARVQDSSVSSHGFSTYHATSNHYGGSVLQNEMDIAFSSLPEKEQRMVIPRDLEGGNTNAYLPGYDPDKIAGSTVYGAEFWPLSAAEAGLIDNGVGNYSNTWWLRSPAMTDNKVSVYDITYNFVDDMGFDVFKTRAIRPAFRLNMGSVILTSAATGDKTTAIGSLESMPAPISGPVKFTAVDSSLSLSSTDTAARTVRRGDTVSIAYSDAVTGPDRYVSCLIENSNGTGLYYGRLVDCASGNGNGTVSFTVPDLADGNYTIELFYEECNGDYYSDFCSLPIEISMTVDNIPTLTAGTVNRTSDTAAVIGFTTDEEGEAFYTVVGSGLATPFKAEIVRDGTSLDMVSGVVKDKAITLTAGPKDIYVVLRDRTGNVSEPLKMTVAVYIPSSVVGFGGKEWAVIGINGNGVASEYNTATLLLVNDPNWGTVEFDDTSNHYKGSILQGEMDDEYNSLPDKEKDMVIPRDLEGDSANYGQEGYDPDKIAGNAVTGASFWPLSVTEAMNQINESIRQYVEYWWLRTPGDADNYAAFVDQMGNTYFTGHRWESGGVILRFACRPAFKLSLSNIYFTSAAVGGKSSATVGSGLISLQTSTGAVKLTAKNASQILNVTATESQAKQKASTLTFGYTNATVGANQYISCVLLDSNYTVAYYGKLKDCSVDSSGDLSVPLAGVLDGTYTLQIFGEQANGDNYTDFCSAPTSMTLNVSGGKGKVSNFDGTVFDTIADVSSYEEFVTAVENTGYPVINAVSDFSLGSDVTINRVVWITSDTGNTINTRNHSLIIGSSGSVTLDEDLTLTGTVKTVQVTNGGNLNLPVTYTGTVSTTGNGGIAIYATGETSVVNIAGGTVSAGSDAMCALCVGDSKFVTVNGGTISGSGNAYGIYMQQGSDGRLKINVNDNGPVISNIYYSSESANDYPVLTSLSGPISMFIGEVRTLNADSLFGENSGLVSPTASDFSAELNFDSASGTVSPTICGDYSMTLRLTGGVDVTLPVTVTTGFAGGDGTSGDPYQIETAEQLNRIRGFLGLAYQDTYFQLTAPIDLLSYTNWVPIGDDTNPFCGHLYGYTYDSANDSYTYYEISGLTINHPGLEYVGLFGYCAGAEINGVAIRNANVIGGTATGALVGQSAGNSGSGGTLVRTRITQCSSTGSVTSGSGVAGGLVGIATNTQIAQSYSTVSVTGTNSTAGGLVGDLSITSLIIDCYATGQVSSTGEDKYAGGLVGLVSGADCIINHCYATGKVTGGDETGGLIGHSSSNNINDSYFNIANASSSDNGSKGIGTKTFNMVNESICFANWDLSSSSGSSIWMIDPGVSNPYFRYNEPASHPAPPLVTSAGIVDTNGDSRYNAAIKELTLIYGDTIASILEENVTPADGLVIWNSSNTTVADILMDSNGDITIEAKSIGTATISLKSSSGNTLDSITVTVEPMPLQVTGNLVVEDKIYDGNVNATISAASTLSLDTSTCVNGDIVSANFVATFSDPNVGEDNPVSLSSSTLIGSAAGNYTFDLSGLLQATATILPKELTIDGTFTARSKAYDGTVNAVIDSNNLTLIGRIGDDDVKLVPVIAFNTPDIGNPKNVSLTTDSSLTGTKAGNYNLSFTGAPTYSLGVITAQEVTLGGNFTTNNKVYSGDKTATIATDDLILIGVNSGDDVSIGSVTVEFDSAAVGNGKTVRIVDYTLTGTDAGNYAGTLTGAPTAIADITAKPLTITGSFTVKNKQYDWTTNAEFDTNTLALNGVIGTDTVSLNASATFDDANADTGKTVTLSGSTLTGADAANYTINFVGAPTTIANITKATGLQAPPAPTLQSKSSTSVTLAPNEGQEFSMDNGTTWQTDNVFTGLTPSTIYNFITRIREDPNHEASSASEMLTVTTNATSSGGKSGGDNIGGGAGGGGNGSGATPSTTAKEIRKANVNGVGDATSDTVASVDIVRNIMNGRKVDSVTLDRIQTDKVIQKIIEQGQDKLQIVVDEPTDDKADEISITVLKDALKKLSDSGVALEIKTEGVTIEIPKETVEAISEDGMDLFLLVTPFSNEDEREAEIHNAMKAGVVQTAADGSEVVALGTPLMIESNYQGYPTKLVFSLKDIVIPEDETQRELFLSGLGVYIEHSDGEQEFNRSRIIYDSDGNPVGIEIGISKFSSFLLMSIKNDSEFVISGKAEFGKKLTAIYNKDDIARVKNGKNLITWYRADNKNGKNKKQVAKGSLNYKVTKADQGKYLIVEITPVTTTDEPKASTVKAYVKVAANKAPQAEAMKISGKTVIGSKLTLKYTYQDAESDKEGKTTIQWYRADSADGTKKQKIKNANKSTYTLTKADLGKYIIAEITLVAKTGTKTGTKTSVATKTVISK